ncbi:MAG TPA: DUF447 domain-containing protein [Anaerolineae bacterium]|nr:DUF447 domain-containing protein [Anaerolineae bacterium]
MIIETILTTLDAEGQINCAPMGVEWGEEIILIKPYQDTATYHNLVAVGAAVVNLTDNVLLFAEAAISNPVFATRPAVKIQGVLLQDVCSWREVKVEQIEASQPRAIVTTRVVHRGVAREFLGFNRARHAVLEAAILATRTRFLPREHILVEFERLQVIVDKTAGPQEHEAMSLLTHYVQAELGA